MYITRVTLNNYRNYGSLGLELSPGLNVFTGENAQGKTNLLEAVYFTGAVSDTHLTLPTTERV